MSLLKLIFLGGGFLGGSIAGTKFVNDAGWVEIELVSFSTQ